MKKIILIVLIVVAVAGIAGYLLYNKPHRDIAASTSDFTLTAPALFAEYSHDESAANTKYLDKVIKVRGTVKSIETDEAGNITLTLDAADEMFGVICTLQESKSGSAPMPKVGEQVTIKGVCTGMLMDVVLIRCVLEQA